MLLPKTGERHAASALGEQYAVTGAVVLRHTPLKPPGATLGMRIRRERRRCATPGGTDVWRVTVGKPRGIARGEFFPLLHSYSNATSR